MAVKSKSDARARRHARLRKKVIGTAKVSFERRGRSDRVALAVIDELNEHVTRRTGDDETGTLGCADDLLAKTGVTTRAGVGL